MWGLPIRGMGVVPHLLALCVNHLNGATATISYTKTHNYRRHTVIASIKPSYCAVRLDTVINCITQVQACVLIGIPHVWRIA